MARIEIHEKADNITVDVILPDSESSVETLEMVEALVDAVTQIGLDAIYANEAPVTLSINCSVRGCGYAVRSADGAVVDACPDSLSPLADRLESVRDSGNIVINP